MQNSDIVGEAAEGRGALRGAVDEGVHEGGGLQGGVAQSQLQQPLLAEAAVGAGAALEEAVGEEDDVAAVRQLHLLLRPFAPAGQQPESHATGRLHLADGGAGADQHAGVARAHHPDRAAVGREDEQGDGGEDVRVGAFGD